YTAADLARESGLPRDTVTSALRPGRTPGRRVVPRAGTLTALLQARLTLLRRAGVPGEVVLAAPPSADDGTPLWRLAERARRIMERSGGPMTKQELAAALGCTPRHVTRVMGRLREAGVPLWEGKRSREKTWRIPPGLARPPVPPVHMDAEAIEAALDALADRDDAPPPARRAPSGPRSSANPRRTRSPPRDP